MTCLTVLMVYVIGLNTNLFGVKTGVSHGKIDDYLAPGCPARSVPSLAQMTPAVLVELRSAVRKVMRGRHGTLYQLGVVTPEEPWSDNSPQSSVALFRHATQVPAGYEMRWWASDRDDIAADVFVFSLASDAQKFFERASSDRCRPAGVNALITSPQSARDVAWRNPDGVGQEDVYILRGHRVYRVSDVLASSSRMAGGASQERQRGLMIVNTLACSLPDAGCRTSGH